MGPKEARNSGRWGGHIEAGFVEMKNNGRVWPVQGHISSARGREGWRVSSTGSKHAGETLSARLRPMPPPPAHERPARPYRNQ